MKSKVDTYYHLYIGDKFINERFSTRQAAMDFGRNHKHLCSDCLDKPMKIERVRVLTEITVSYDESKPGQP